MTESIVLDVLLAVLLVGYLVYGWRVGLSHAIFAFAGVVAGAIAAFFLVPVVAAWVAFPAVRPLAVIVTIVGLVALGNVVGSLLGRAARRGVEETPLSGLDRLAGGLATAVAAALIASVVAVSLGQLGVPLLSRAITGSTVLRTITALAPDPVEAWLAELRSQVVDTGLPVISDALGVDVDVPAVDAASPELTAAAQSVVRITGNALACGVAQTGTGFVTADDRVITNAHVVAGVTEPVVESLSGQVIAGRVVYFDPVDDLAVIAVPGLDAPPRPLGEPLAAGSEAAVQGYPFGGPFSSIGAGVVSVRTVEVADIYGQSSSPREVYTIASPVREGNSGGPLLALDGSVVGVVFARNADDPDIGYAMTRLELDPVVSVAASKTTPVDTGVCAAPAG